MKKLFLLLSFLLSIVLMSNTNYGSDPPVTNTAYECVLSIENSQLIPEMCPVVTTLITANESLPLAPEVVYLGELSDQSRLDKLYNSGIIQFENKKDDFVITINSRHEGKSYNSILFTMNSNPVARFGSGDRSWLVETA